MKIIEAKEPIKDHYELTVNDLSYVSIFKFYSLCVCSQDQNTCISFSCLGLESSVNNRHNLCLSIKLLFIAYMQLAWDLYLLSNYLLLACLVILLEQTCHKQDAEIVISIGLSMLSRRSLKLSNISLVGKKCLSFDNQNQYQGLVYSDVLSC